MRVVLDLEPATAESARLLSQWLAPWGVAAGGGVELPAAGALAALLDLQKRCFEQGISLNAVFPDNQ